MPSLKIMDSDIEGIFNIVADIHRVKERSWAQTYEQFLSSCKIPYKDWRNVRVTEAKLKLLVAKATNVIPIKIKKGDAVYDLVKSVTSPYHETIKKVEAWLKKHKGLTPFKWQKSGNKWLLGKKKACLADDTGLGKSGQILMTAMVLHLKKEIDGGILIVGSKISGMTWRHEVPMWTPFKFYEIKSKADFRYPKRGEVVFCTWSKLQYNKAKLPPRNMLLVGDEIHNVKNPKSQRAKSWNKNKSSVLSRDGRVIGASASVNENSPLNLWNGLNACGCAEEIFGNFKRFTKLFGGRRGTFGIVWDGEVDPVVRHMMKSHTLRRSKRDVMSSLPPLIGPRTLEVELSTKDPRWEHLKALEEFQEKSKLLMSQFLHWASNTKETSFEQISEVRKIISAIKIPAALDYAADNATFDDPLIIMSSNRAVVEEFDKLDHWAVIYGGVSEKKRQEAVDALNAGKIKGIACTIRAASESLTLSKARRMLFVDLDWNWARNYQGIGRIERLNQKRTMFIDVLCIANSIDEKIQEVLAKKIKWKEGTFEK